MPIKQVIVVRSDLNMRRGKEIAQGSHGSMAWLSNRIRNSKHFALTHTAILHFSADEAEWLQGAFTKVVVQVGSEEELLQVHTNALALWLTSELIVDSGRTEFHGVATPTCCAIGPNQSAEIDKVTGALKLF